MTSPHPTFDHPAVETAWRFAMSGGYAFPDLANLQCINITEREEKSLFNGRMVIENLGGQKNTIFVPLDMNLDHELRIRFFGANNVVVVGQNSRVFGIIRMHSDHCATVIAGENGQDAFFQITHWSIQTTAFIGSQTTSNGAQLVMMGEEASILIGEDCMFSTGIWVKTSDMHAIVDLISNEVINETSLGSSVSFGRHVWIGQGALVVQPMTVGDGSIIGANSFVNKSIPPRTLWAGTPARQLREEVTWLRSHVLVSEELAAVRSALGVNFLG